LLLWPDRCSYTGQPSAELHLPGSAVLADAVLQHLIDAGARLARAGEFTMRAFLAGRLDLTQAEGVLEVVEATDRQSLEQGLRRLAGGISADLSALRHQLLDLLADLEAGLDFVEEDLSFIDSQQLSERLADAIDRLHSIRAQFAERGLSDRMARVVLIGRPNAGKSSLLNALCGEMLALVADHAGTTRDMVEGTWRIGTRSVKLLDTAGAMKARDAIDQQAQWMRDSVRAESDLRLVCIDASMPTSLTADEQAEWRFANSDPQTLLVLTKYDAASPQRRVLTDQAIATSSRSSVGLRKLASEVEARLQAIFTASSSASSTNARCGAAIDQCLATLDSAASLVAHGSGDELIASELRVALQTLGTITGEVSTDDLLDRIFSRFCIGK
jgi:tRNA modification GTPase